MSVWRYLAGWSLLVTWVVPVTVAAVVLRRRLAPGWTGALSRLAEAVLVLAALLGVAQLLGTVGELRRLPMTAGCLVLGGLGTVVAVRLRPRPAPRDEVPPVGRVGWAVTAGVCALLALRWGPHVIDSLDTGIYQSDSLTYHLPYAVEFFRSGSTTHLVLNFPGGGVSFHPADSELLHALGMLAFARDWLSPLLNLGWLALALLAGWCVGRRTGHGPTTLTGVALVLVAPVMANSQPGSATSDVALVACLLAMAVFLLTAATEPPAWFALAVAGAAAGLALSSKFNALPLVGAATVLVPLFAAKGRRLASTVAWGAPLLATGSFWYLRNLVRVGNPVPLARVGPLPVSHQALIEKYGYSVMSYASDLRVIRHSFLPGLRVALGPLWFVLLGTAMAAVLLALRPAVPGRARGLALVAVVGALGYAVTPTSALGARGHPVQFLFVSNVRYLMPAAAIALSLLALVLPGRRRWQVAALGVLGVTTFVTAVWSPQSVPTGHARRLVALAAAAAVAATGAWLVRRQPRLLAAGAAAAAVIAVVAGLPVSRYYLAHRYAVAAPDAADPYRWVRGVHAARIGMDGFTEGYVLTGADLSNDVRYVGEVGPHYSLREFTDCQTYRRAVEAGGYRYLVFAPRFVLTPSGRLLTRWPLANRWVSGSGGVRLVLRSSTSAVYQVIGPLDPGRSSARPASGTSVPCGGTSPHLAKLNTRPPVRGRVA